MPARGCVAVVIGVNLPVKSDYSPVIDGSIADRSPFSIRAPLQVLRQRDLLRRTPLGRLPGLVGDAVPARVLTRSAEGQQHAELVAAVHEPPAHARRHPRELTRAQLALLAAF